MHILLSFDDYSQDNYRLANLLLKYNLQKNTIFFIDLGRFWESDFDRQAMIKSLSFKGFQIGCHTFAHPPDMKLLSYPQLVHEIVDSKAEIEKLIGKRIIWFCYPRGRHNDLVRQVVKEANFKYARTTQVLSTESITGNYYKFDPMAVKTSVHIYPRKEYQYRAWTNVAKEMFEQAKKNSGCFHLWGHAEEIGRLNQWDRLEEFLKYITK